ncbi:hypothetical protein MLD38_034299 [Melastoma candidum]|uniref:Uncharacterized protein n=1 Tax=Melastoma candidum TaxID=119954 RepID=A0ACB9M9H8_9MYRT|nr:hypothetical protein MLD38_034299 [Melastoma candidum]
MTEEEELGVVVEPDPQAGGDGLLKHRRRSAGELRGGVAAESGRLCPCCRQICGWGSFAVDGVNLVIGGDALGGLGADRSGMETSMGCVGVDRPLQKRGWSLDVQEETAVVEFDSLPRRIGSEPQNVGATAESWFVAAGKAGRSPSLERVLGDAEACCSLRYGVSRLLSLNLLLGLVVGGLLASLTHPYLGQGGCRRIFVEEMPVLSREDPPVVWKGRRAVYEERRQERRNGVRLSSGMTWGRWLYASPAALWMDGRLLVLPGRRWREALVLSGGNRRAQDHNCKAMAVGETFRGGSAVDRDDDGRPRRTGTLQSCIAHILTAVIGSGVLSLAWSIAQMGWIAGPIYLLCMAGVTYASASLLSDCYRSPDPVTGQRNYSYKDTVKVNLGTTQMYICGFLQYVSMYGTCIAYVITTATSLRLIHHSACPHKDGREISCEFHLGVYMVIFGGVQIMTSQIRDFHNMYWLSAVAAMMSFSYSFTGFGLAIVKVIRNGKFRGTISGVPASSPARKTWLTFQAMGDIAFAYPYSLILLEIQDTLKSSPPENKIMKKASVIAILITTFFYLCCGCFGYAAFGMNTPGSLLTGFETFRPHGFLDFANACIVLHLWGGYQLYSQPLFAAMEGWIAGKFLHTDFVNKMYNLKPPLLPAVQLNPFRLCFRSAYVVTTVGIALLFPYFNSVLGILGSLNFWPLAIYFPVEMYFRQKGIEPWSKLWVGLRLFSLVSAILSIVTLAGSVMNIAYSLSVS